MEQGEMIIGLDPHKSSNTIAVLERDETIVLQGRFENSVEGFDEMRAAVADHIDQVWAVEGANGMGRNVAQRLVAAGETVVDVPAKLSTRVRVYPTDRAPANANGPSARVWLEIR